MYTSRKLYFPSIRTLRGEDPFEGLATDAAYRLTAHLMSSPEARRANFPGIDDKMPLVLSELQNFGSETISDVAFVSCWHLSEHKSAALWKIFSRKWARLVLRTSVKRLAEAIDPSKIFVFRHSIPRTTTRIFLETIRL